MLNRFCDIWEKWHLNNMRPYCTHQKELGWDKIALEKVTLYNYKLTLEAVNLANKAERAAIKALRHGETFTPTPEQAKFASLPYSITTHEKLDGEDAKYYEPCKPQFPGDKEATKVERLGWLRQKDHPRGILSKPCPVCGYKYGSSWLKEEIPGDVLEFLVSLPVTKKYYPWAA